MATEAVKVTFSDPSKETEPVRSPDKFNVIAEDQLSDSKAVPFISLNVVPSVVNSHLSEDSFHLIETLGDVPRSISMPAFSVGEAVTLLFKIKILSATVTDSTLTETVVPETVKFPEIVTSSTVLIAVKSF